MTDIAIVGLPDLADLLHQNGLEVLTDAVAGRAAKAIQTTVDEGYPVVLGDGQMSTQNAGAFARWSRFVDARTRLVVVELAAGGTDAGHDFAAGDTLIAPVAVDDVLASLGFPALAAGAVLMPDGSISVEVQDAEDEADFGFDAEDDEPALDDEPEPAFEEDIPDYLAMGAHWDDTPVGPDPEQVAREAEAERQARAAQERERAERQARAERAEAERQARFEAEIAEAERAADELARAQRLEAERAPAPTIPQSLSFLSKRPAQTPAPAVAPEPARPVHETSIVASPVYEAPVAPAHAPTPVIDDSLLYGTPDTAPVHTVNGPLAPCVISHMGKGGQSSKSACALLLAHYASTLTGPNDRPLRVTLFDGNVGQGDVTVGTRLISAPLPTMYDAQVSDDASLAFITAEQANAYRPQNFGAIEFNLVLAPQTKDQARAITETTVRRCLTYARQHSDLVIIDTQVRDLTVSGLWGVWGQLLHTGAYGVAACGGGSNSRLRLIQHAKDMVDSGVDPSHLLYLFNAVTEDDERSLGGFGNGGNVPGVFLGIVRYDPSVANENKLGYLPFGEGVPELREAIVKALFLATGGLPQFAPVAAPAKKKRGLFGRKGR